MIELILLTLLIIIGFLWFRNLSDNSYEINEDTEGDKHINKWGAYISIIIVSGFFIWLLVTNGKLN